MVERVFEMVHTLRGNLWLLPKIKKDIRKILFKNGIISHNAKIDTSIEHSSNERFYDFLYVIPPVRRIWFNEKKNSIFDHPLKIMFKPDNNEQCRKMRVVVELGGTGKFAMDAVDEDHPYWDTLKVIIKEFRDLVKELPELIEKAEPAIKGKLGFA